MSILLISPIVFVSYFVFTWIYLGIQPSISDTVFKLTGIKKYLFHTFILGISIPVLIWGINKSIFSSFAALFISIDAFAALTKKQPIKSANHVIGASGGILLAYAGFIFESLLSKLVYPMENCIQWNSFLADIYFWSTAAFLISAIVILPIGKKKGIKNHTTWIEVSAYIFWILPNIIKI